MPFIAVGLLEVIVPNIINIYIYVYISIIGCMICHGISFKQKACLAMEPSEENSAWRAWPTCPSPSLCLKIQLTNEAERFSAKTGLWCRSLSVPDCQQAWHVPMPPPNLALKEGSDLRRSRCRCWGNEEKLVAWFILFLWYDIVKWFAARIIIQQSENWYITQYYDSIQYTQEVTIRACTIYSIHYTYLFSMRVSLVRLHSAPPSRYGLCSRLIWAPLALLVVIRVQKAVHGVLCYLCG